MNVQKTAIRRLARAVLAFFGAPVPPPPGTQEAPEPARTGRAKTTAQDAGPESQARRLLSLAQVAEASGNYAVCLKLCTAALALDGLQVAEQAELLITRGLSFYFLGSSDEAVGDWTRVIELPGAPVEQVAQALLSRGVRWGEKGETEKELADYTRVIEQLPGAPVEAVAQALYNRGVTWGQKGEAEKELADYTRVIEQLPGAPVEQVAQALFNRGVTWGEKGETEMELADYTRVIEQLPGAPVKTVAWALANRGWCNYKRNAYSAFLADTEAALRSYPDLDVAAFNLGLALLACGRDAEALAAYKRAGERFPEAIKTFGLPVLANARKSWLTEDRAEPVMHLLRLLQARRRR